MLASAGVFVVCLAGSGIANRAYRVYGPEKKPDSWGAGGKESLAETVIFGAAWAPVSTPHQTCRMVWKRFKDRRALKKEEFKKMLEENPELKAVYEENQRLKEEKEKRAEAARRRKEERAKTSRQKKGEKLLKKLAQENEELGCKTSCISEDSEAEEHFGASEVSSDEN